MRAGGLFPAPGDELRGDGEHGKDHRGDRQHDAGIAERTVLIEFDSFEQAVAAHESAAYQEALVALSDGVERDFRIVEGID